MTYDPHKHHRRSIRLKGYDYSQDGLYFVTICLKNGLCLLGDVVEEKMILNPAGEMVERKWLELPDRFPQIELGVFQVMPNHFHGILGIQNANLHTVGAGLVPAQVVPAQVVPAQVVPAQVVPAQVVPDDKRATTGDTPTGVPAQGVLDDKRATTRDTPTGVPAQVVPDDKRATTRDAPTGVPAILGDMVGAFKSITTNEYITGVKKSGWEPFPGKLWQRNYYEHIIRNERALNAIREYIIHNPANWLADQLHPNGTPNKFNTTWKKK